MKFLIIFLLLFSNVSLAIQLPEEIQGLKDIEIQEGFELKNGEVFMDTIEKDARSVWDFMKSIFIWIWEKVSGFWSAHIWSRIAGPLEQQIDTRKQQIEEKVEETTESIKESLLQRFKRIIRYDK